MFPFLVLALLFRASFASTNSVRYLGRHALNAASGVASFDWVASGVQFRVSSSCKGKVGALVGGNITIDVLTYKNRFAVFVGEKEDTLAADIHADSPTRQNISTISIDAAIAAGGLVTIRKTTEDFKMKAVELYGIHLPSGYCLDALSPKSSSGLTKIDFYGDSDTAAFGVDGSSSEPLACLTKMESFENFAHGWVRRALMQIAEAENYTIFPDIRVQAVSGIGVYKNAAAGIGTPTYSSLTMPKVIRRSLYSVDADDYKPDGWIPDLIVIYLGSNDYTAQLSNPTEEQFLGAYSAMTSSILSLYDNRTTKVLHICGFEDKPCEYIAKYAASQKQAYTNTFDKGEPKEGCIGHRSASQQAVLGEKLAPCYPSLRSILK